MKYITFTIKTLENVKMGGQGSAYDTEYALSYITGSTIRGAFISKYLKENKIKDLSNDLRNRELLLGGEMKFLNAYPSIDGERTIPFPNCFYAEKDQLNMLDYGEVVQLHNELEMSQKEGMEKVRVSEFCLLKELYYHPVRVEKIFNLHITKNKDKNNIYRYEAIKQGQTFIGIITFDGTEEQLNQCVELLEDNIFYLGGSKGTGYGKCKLTDVEVYDNNVEIVAMDDNFYEEDSSETFYILALSDIISRNQWGQVIGSIDANYLKEQLRLEEVELIGGSVATQLISGYNNTWKTRIPQITGIKAGSVLKYKFKGKVDNALVKELMDRGIGDRREEGYGRFILMNNIGAAKLLPFEEEGNKNGILPPTLKEDEKVLLEGILDSVLVSRVESNVKRDVLKRFKGYRNRLNQAQLGKLIQVFFNMKSMKEEDGKSYLSRYLKEIEEKKENRAVFYQFEDSKLNGMSLKDCLKKASENLDNIEDFKSTYNNQNQKDLEIFKVEPSKEKNSEYVYQVNVRTWEEFFRFVHKMMIESR